MESIFKKYKILLPIPVVMLILAVVFLITGYLHTGEWFIRSVEMKGGSLITINNAGIVDAPTLQKSLPWNAIVREYKGTAGNFFSIEVSSDVNPDEVIEELRKLGISTEQVSVNTIMPSLSSAFWTQAQIAIIMAFVLMSIIVFIIFRTPTPSVAVIIAAVSDIIITLAVMQVLGIELSFASLAAILTLIGYSVDTDVLLTTRVLRGAGSLKERINSAMKTGLTMSLTTIGALSAVIIISVSQVLSQISTVLLIGLLIDLVNTWIQNAAILTWHAERRGYA